MKLVPYVYPHTRIKLRKDPRDNSVSGEAMILNCVALHTFLISKTYQCCHATKDFNLIN